MNKVTPTADVDRDLSTREAPFSMMPRSVVRQIVCSECVKVYLTLDYRQQDDGKALRGLTWLLDELGWETRRLKEHLGHLAAARLIRLTPEPKPGGGWGHVHMPIVHNPARRLYGSPVAIPGVFGAPSTRSKKPPKVTFLDAVKARQSDGGTTSPVSNGCGGTQKTCVGAQVSVANGCAGAQVLSVNPSLKSESSLGCRGEVEPAAATGKAAGEEEVSLVGPRPHLGADSGREDGLSRVTPRDAGQERKTKKPAPRRKFEIDGQASLFDGASGASDDLVIGHLTIGAYKQARP